MDTKEKIAVMQAWLDGKVIEVKRIGLESGTNIWHQCARRGSFVGDLRWDWLNYDYRVKPEPLVRWAVLFSDGSSCVHLTRQRALEFYSSMSSETQRMARLVKLVEVPEE